MRAATSATPCQSARADHFTTSADGADYPLSEGMTLREALSALRKAGRDAFGNIGGALACMSDGTTLEVENQPASDGGELMSSQLITRGVIGSNACRRRLKR
jgi:hypothetical protein